MHLGQLWREPQPLVSPHRKLIAAGLILMLLLLFLLANRASYKGYFQSDDLDTMSWASVAGFRGTFLHGFVMPRFDATNFRPVGAYYYRVMFHAFGLNFAPYVAVVTVIHLLNVAMLYLALRWLKFPPIAGGAGALFYLFHAATLELYWKPMYVFDLLCATFCLVTLLLYMRGHWLLGLIPFWFAYKSKEVAVMLPVALAAFEFLAAERRWKRLIPYFLISLNFGVQALLFAPKANHDYALQLTWGAFVKCVTFYSSQVFFIPYAGLILLAVPIFIRDRRVFLGLLAMLAMLCPMLILPGRLFSVYWYVPFLGVSILLAALAERTPRWLLVAGFTVWFGVNFELLREKRNTILHAAMENRSYVEGLANLARQHPEIQVVGYESFPWGVALFGSEASVHILFGYKTKAFVYPSPEFERASAKSISAITEWNWVTHEVTAKIRRPE